MKCILLCLTMYIKLISTQGRSLEGRGENRPGRRVEGASIKPTIDTKFLFYGIILVCF